jgi:putative RecB family exonuclease
MSEIIKLSASKTKLFKDCAKKYNYSYNLHLPKKTWDFHVFGKFIHAILENFHKELLDGSKEPNNIIMTRVYKDAKEEYAEKLTKAMLDEAYKMIKSYLEHFASDIYDGVQILSAEQAFNIPITNHITLNGFIDRVQIDKDGILSVIDYKSAKSKQFLKNDFFQLLTYAYALLMDNPHLEVIRGSYMMLRHKFELISKDFTREEILSIKDQYEDYAKNIEAEKEFPANPTFLCSWCDFIDLCPEGSTKVNKNNDKRFGEIKW